MDKKDMDEHIEIPSYSKERIDYNFEDAKIMLKKMFEDLNEEVGTPWGEKEENDIEFIFNSIYEKAVSDAIRESAKIQGFDIGNLNHES
jgi:hypothetical protein